MPSQPVFDFFLNGTINCHFGHYGLFFGWRRPATFVEQTNQPNKLAGG